MTVARGLWERGIVVAAHPLENRDDDWATTPPWEQVLGDVSPVPTPPPALFFASKWQ